MGMFGKQKLSTLEDLFWMEIQDLHSAEEQLTEALPKMAETAHNPQLKNAITQHLEQTRQQLDRLQQIFDQHGQSPDGETCEAMEGLISEGEDILEAEGDANVRDAGLIAAAQRVEHYEISGYGTARTLAQQLGFHDAERLLQMTLQEEKEADALLNSIAESSINKKAARA